MADDAEDTPRIEHLSRSSSDDGDRSGDRSQYGNAWSRNFALRLAAGVPAVLVVLLVIVFAPPRLIALIVAAAGVYGTYEYVRMVSVGAGSRLPMRVLLGGAAVMGLGAMMGTPAALNVGLLLAIGALVWVHWFGDTGEGRDGQVDLGLGLTGLLLVPWLLNHVGLMAQVPGGRGFLAFLVVALTLNDTLAYLVGTLFGRIPLLPSVSPRKTVEGAMGGLAGGALGGAVAFIWLGGAPDGYAFLDLLMIGALLAVAGQAGDLLESKLKRLNGADDSGTFLPGHGGMLDRLDAYLVAGPLSYFLLRWAVL